MAYQVWENEVQRRIDGLNIGSQFILSELMQDVWADMCADQREQDVGSDFSRAVRRGNIRGAVFDHVKRGPKATVWRRVD